MNKGSMQENVPTWIAIQRKTFTAWVNYYLSKRFMAITHLERDLSDGIMLIQLLEILSNQVLYKTKRFRPHANPRMAQLENVSFSLAFLENKGIKLGIDAADIVDGKQKMVLALVWALILHYQLMVWVDMASDKQTAKGSLLNWVREAVINQGLSPTIVKDFSRSFSDGRIFVSLVNYLRHGTLSNSVLSAQPREVMQKAFEAAEMFLGIAPLLDVDDILAGRVDEHCVMTYVSLFRVRAYEMTKNKNETEDIDYEFVPPARPPPARTPPRPNSETVNGTGGTHTHSHAHHRVKASPQQWRASLQLYSPLSGSGGSSGNSVSSSSTNGNGNGSGGGGSGSDGGGSSTPRTSSSRSTSHSSLNVSQNQLSKQTPLNVTQILPQPTPKKTLSAFLPTLHKSPAPNQTQPPSPRYASTQVTTTQTTRLGTRPQSVQNPLPSPRLQGLKRPVPTKPLPSLPTSTKSLSSLPISTKPLPSLPASKSFLSTTVLPPLVLRGDQVLDKILGQEKYEPQLRLSHQSMPHAPYTEELVPPLPQQSIAVESSSPGQLLELPQHYQSQTEAYSSDPIPAAFSEPNTVLNSDSKDTLLQYESTVPRSGDGDVVRPAAETHLPTSVVRDPTLAPQSLEEQQFQDLLTLLSPDLAHKPNLRGHSMRIPVSPEIGFFPQEAELSQSNVSTLPPERGQASQVEDPSAQFTSSAEQPLVSKSELRKLALREIEADPSEATETEATEIQRSAIKLNKIGPLETEVKIQPNEIPPNEIQPNEIQPNEIQWNEIQPNEIQWNEIQPNEIQPNEIQPNEIQPNEIQPNEIQSNEIQPNESEIQPNEIELSNISLDKQGYDEPDSSELPVIDSELSNDVEQSNDTDPSNDNEFSSDIDLPNDTEKLRQFEPFLEGTPSQYDSTSSSDSITYEQENLDQIESDHYAPSGRAKSASVRESSIRNSYSALEIFRLSSRSYGNSRKSEVPAEVLPKTGVPVAPFLALAMYDYMPDKTDENELAFVKGDIVTILETNPSGWWKGEHCGNFGWVPNEFVSPLDVQEAANHVQNKPMQVDSEEPVVPEEANNIVATSSDLAQNNSGDLTANTVNYDGPNPSATNESIVPPPSEPNQNATTPRSQKSNLRTFQPQLQPAPRQSILQPEVTRAGFLRKKGAKRRNWTRRWFVLKGHSLTYFKSEKADKPKGGIVLDLAVVGKSQRKPFGFFVRTPERILMLWPVSKEERDAWIEAITNAITVQYSGIDRGSQSVYLTDPTELVDTQQKRQKEQSGSALPASDNDINPYLGAPSSVASGSHYEEEGGSQSEEGDYCYMENGLNSLVSGGLTSLASGDPKYLEYQSWMSEGPLDLEGVENSYHEQVQEEPGEPEDQDDQSDNEDMISPPLAAPLRLSAGPTPSKRGYLFKKNRSGNSWCKRFFLLESGIICYFVSDKMSKRRGSMVLNQATVVNMYNKKPFGFSIVQPSDPYDSVDRKSSRAPGFLRTSVSTSSNFKWPESATSTASTSAPSRFTPISYTPNSFKSSESTTFNLKSSAELTRSCFKRSTTTHKTFTLLAQNEDEMQAWVQAIRAHLRLLERSYSNMISYSPPLRIATESSN